MEKDFNVLEPVIASLNADSKWIDNYLITLLGDNYVKHERYQNIIFIYGSSQSYAKICELKHEIVKALSVKFPHAAVTFRRATQELAL